jgi:SAM-dependent methyltransferase
MMSSINRYSDYDNFAWIYNERWGYFYSGNSFAILEKLLLQYLPSDAHILDLCCGTGKLAQALIGKGYRVTGIDSSEGMIRFARENAPNAEFIVEDARNFRLPSIYNGAISAYDSLNHIRSLEDLTLAFRNVYECLIDGGLFLFDLNMEDAYKSFWKGSFGTVEDDYAHIARSSYDTDEKIGKLIFTIFRLLEGKWERSDLTFLQKCYSEEEIISALESVGFIDINVYNYQKGLEGLYKQIGRSFFVCHKP